jgi:hypothetical protein
MKQMRKKRKLKLKETSTNDKSVIEEFDHFIGLIETKLDTETNKVVCCLRGKEEKDHFIGSIEAELETETKEYLGGLSEREERKVDYLPIRQEKEVDR